MRQSFQRRRGKVTFFAYGLRGAGSFLDLEQAAQNRAGGVHGHIGFGIHLHPGWKLGGLRRPMYTTVLRDPVQRTISQFQYEARSPMGMAFHAKVPRRGEPLSEQLLFEWLDDMRTSRPNNSAWAAHNNPMTQQLCCWADDGSKHTTFTGLCNGGPVTDAVYHCAQRHLDTFDVVGIMEEMNDTLRLLQITAGVTAPSTEVSAEYRNSAQGSEQVLVSARGRERLAQLAHYDGQLYQHALLLFNRQRKAAFTQELRS